jgi:hypothetical protein
MAKVNERLIAAEGALSLLHMEYTLLLYVAGRSLDEIKTDGAWRTSRAYFTKYHGPEAERDAEGINDRILFLHRLIARLDCGCMGVDCVKHGASVDYEAMVAYRDRLRAEPPKSKP